MPATVEILELTLKFPRGLHIALIIDRCQPTAEDVGFFETLAFNRGIAMRAFQSRSTATEWLDALESSAQAG